MRAHPAPLALRLARLAAPVFVAASLLLPAHAGRSEAPAAPDPRAVELASTLAAGQNAFAIDLYGRLKDQPGNLLFSPYSIQTALAMARAGARGETAMQMDRVLRLPKDATPESWKALVATVRTAPPVPNWTRAGRQADVPAYSISVANALFGQKGYPFVPASRQLVATGYGAELRDVDFAAGAAVRKEINDWVLAKTNRRIPDLLPVGQPTPEMRLALVNAIHFVAEWFIPFSEGRTNDAVFTGEGGAKMPVRMMRFDHYFRYVDDGDVHVAAIPYKGQAADMVLVLPKAVDGLATVERALTPERVAKWWGDQSRDLELELPRFRFEAATDVTKHLSAMGMPDVFLKGKADFTGIANVPDDPLYLGAAFHKAFIAVDEKGTEAAAAMADLGGSAVGDDDKPIKFVCNHPFLFLLRHRATGALLFVGRLSAPAYESTPAPGPGPDPARGQAPALGPNPTPAPAPAPRSDR